MIFFLSNLNKIFNSDFLFLYTHENFFKKSMKTNINAFK